MAGNSFGNLFRLTSFGESHGIAVGAIVDGCPAGLELNEADIQAELDKRKPGSGIAGTKRKESDTVKILSGVFEGKTTGTPICMVVYNEDQQSAGYELVKDKFRPGHADYTYFKKYGFYDYRGGGRSSGRETVARVAAGAIAKKLLDNQGIKILGFVKAIGSIECKEFSEKDLEKIYENELRCPDAKAEEKMKELIKETKASGNSIGGIVEIRAVNVPAGLGEPVFEKLDSQIAGALMGIGAVKGVEIGSGFNAARSFGSENNDQIIAEKGNAKFLSNNAGGILGGISTGQDIIARIAVKPTPSILKKQKTISKSIENTEIEIAGRHDVCICPRIVPVAEAMLALALVNALLEQKARKQ
ncbi:MAG: chorismate synthase [Candidatus Diapherotrites archaeon]|nr:chorismate synthase [Candidatus Diapherotrites archaeon]